MSQISPPLRILLVGSVLFLAAWMMFLRPGGGTDTAAPAPATTPAASDTPASAPGQAVDTARDAATAAEGAAAARAGEAPATGTAPGTSAAAGTTEAPVAAPASQDEVNTKGLPAAVAKAVEARKVLVMLFWNPKAADDRMVRAELRKVDRYDGRVVVHVADVDRIARYAPIAQGVEVEQSPSIVVVDGDRRATLMTGYTDAGSIQQAVADAVGTDALIARKPINDYFRSVDKLAHPGRRLRVGVAVLLWTLVPVCIVFGGWTGLLMAVVGAAYGGHLMARSSGLGEQADGFSWWSSPRRRPGASL